MTATSVHDMTHSHLLPQEEAMQMPAGISEAIQVKIRPANLGLGYGGFKEASTLKVNRQLEAQIRGEAPPDTV